MLFSSLPTDRCYAGGCRELCFQAWESGVWLPGAGWEARVEESEDKVGEDAGLVL
jgi:hypothetical protein